MRNFISRLFRKRSLYVVISMSLFCFLVLSHNLGYDFKYVGQTARGALYDDERYLMTGADTAEFSSPQMDVDDLWSWRKNLLTAEDLNAMSELGNILFLGKTPKYRASDKNFTILVWKHGKALERRLIYWYTKERHEPFEQCSVQNCHLTYDDKDLNSSDAVFFHLHKTKGPDTLPKTRLSHQRWIFLSDESPYNTFLLSKKYSMKDYNGIFNWSMHYRMDSDIPVPYGRTVPLSEGVSQKISFSQDKKRFVAVMGSNCGGSNKRWSYVHELEKYIAVDTYGGCGKLKCPGHFKKDCPILSEYKFYLAFENSNCKEYITEKLWWNAFEKGSIPVVMGTNRSDYEKHLPPNSFIHVDDFATPQDLAKYLLHLNNSESDLDTFHEWRNHYKVLNEHGYFQTPVYHYCRICEALNYNNPSPKVYHHLELYWNPPKHCYPPTWQTRLKEAENRSST